MISMLLHATLILRFDPPMILTIHFNHQAVLTVNSKRPQRDFHLPPLILEWRRPSNRHPSDFRMTWKRP